MTARFGPYLQETDPKVIFQLFFFQTTPERRHLVVTDPVQLIHQAIDNARPLMNLVTFCRTLKIFLPIFLKNLYAQ